MDTPLTVYDELRYPGRFYPYATAERLATIAALYGLDSAPVTRCRVLELACGEGGNLIPQALVFPDSEFFGIDLAATSIERGRALAEQVGLRNIQLRAQNLLEFPRDAGTFDYIVAHGLYSWVPERVREEILEICSRHLAPRGLAYISYNALPGGHFKQYARDLMLFHTRFFSDPGVKVREARNIIDFVTVAHPHASPERESLRREMAPYENYDSFLFHDLLAETNESVYFLDFMDQAARRGLQFVSEATLENFLVNQWPDSLRRQIESLGDRLLQEQYRDFIGCRRFRRTVLCRAGHDLDPHLRPERMKQFTFVSALHPVKPIKDLHDGEMVDFRTASGHTIASDQAMPKALYLELGDAWPHALTYDELLGQVVRRVGIDPGELDDENLGRFHRLLLSSFPALGRVGQRFGQSLDLLFHRRLGRL